MNFQDELQTLRNEIARLRQENGDLGEKLAVEIQKRTELQSAAEHILGLEVLRCPEGVDPDFWESNFEAARVALANSKR